MRIDVDHTTKYKFSDQAKQIIQTLRLTPNSNNFQNVVDWDIYVNCDASFKPFTDAYGNKCHIIFIDKPVDELVIETIGTVDTFKNEGNYRINYEDSEDIIPRGVFKRFTGLANKSKKMEEFARDSAQGKGIVANLHNLMLSIGNYMEYKTGETDVNTDAVTAFEAKSGVCQDFSHIFISCSRILGIPSRYVSGHLLLKDGETQQEGSHAWAESYIDGLGWVPFDPVNGICADENYIKIAIGLDYHDAAPVSGARYGGGIEALKVDLNIRRVNRQSQQ